MSSITIILSVALLVTVAVATEEADHFSVACLSDGPYGQHQIAHIPTLVHAVNQAADVRFAVHVGDIKSGGDICNNTYFRMIKTDYFDNLSPPLLYTPGDNEWTDCHRVSNGIYNPLERLNTLRSIFFSTPSLPTGGKTKASHPVTQQVYPHVENAMWQHGPVLFGTVHIVGSNNNRRPWDQLHNGDMTDARVREYRERDKAAIEWIEKLFRRAIDSDMEGVVIFTHAGMWAPWELANDIPLNGFDNVVQVLNMWVAKFDRPTWLINGDSHDFSVITPFMPNATHPLTKHFGKPGTSVYRRHGEEYDAVKFKAITLETYGPYDALYPWYDPDVVMEWFELKIRPGMGNNIFSYERHRLSKK